MARARILSLLALAISLGHAPVSAHPLAPSLLEIIEDAPGHASVQWKTPINKVPGSDATPQLPPQCQRTGDVQEEALGTALVERWEISCSAPLSGLSVSVDDIASSKANAILRIALADGRVVNSILTADNETFQIPERETAGTVLRSYGQLGIDHILTGPDHLLFVLGLILLSATLRQLLWTVTAFTAGHSVTLSLAALGFVAVPTGPVEAMIAFSILVVAVELARDPRGTSTAISRYPWLIAFPFGLLHGLGFAGALAEIGLPVGEIPLALLSFNLGIEAGQLLFCAIVLGIYLAFRALQIRPLARGRLFAAYFIGTLAAFWFFERVAASLPPLVS
jgi:hydrogenase/urease accessory protein HupE